MKDFLSWLEEGKKWIPHDLKKGSFTKYCGGKVDAKCIEKGKHSSDPKTRKRATLAQTFRKMNHKKGS